MIRPRLLTSDHDGPEEVTTAEVGILGATLALAVVGVAALATAQLGVFSIASVALSSGVTLAALALAIRRLGLPVRFDPLELVMVGIVFLVAVFMFFPGFPYNYADKDPGAYVVHAHGIAREGSVIIDDEIIEQAGDVPGALFSPGQRFPGIRVTEDGTGGQSQFFHYYPALLAVASAAIGQSAVFHVNPLIGVLSVLVVALVARRLGGLVAGTVAGVVLSVSMSQVWQAKSPSSEVLAQLFFHGVLLAVILSIRTRSRGVALVGGLLVSVGFLNRPDGILGILLVAGLGALVIAADRVDGRFWAFAAGAGLLLPYGLLNAYDLRVGYSLGNDMPSMPVVLGLMTACVLGGVVLRAARLRWWDAIWSRIQALSWPETRITTTIGLVFTAVTTLVMVGFWYREDLLGLAYTHLLGPEPTRSYDERNLQRLAFYTTIRALPLSVLGLAILTTGKWRITRWVFALPGVALLAVYLWEAQISPRMMWWVRRYVPTSIPFIVITGAVAVGWIASRRNRLVASLSIPVVALLLVAHLDLSLPLRSHREFANSYDFSRDIADVSGDEQGLFLWERPTQGIYDPSRNFGSVLWLTWDELSVLLPEDPTDAIVAEYASRFPEHPVFIVSHGATPPPTLSGSNLTLARELKTSLPLWGEALTVLPTEPQQLGVHVSVWEYRR
ncbi:hypothetical protein [Actinospongicola halichondriae]|uniref:hypothetical protein n=1 Tax=Actinospongicola halichondriae TaxID=3236844 RepID=UPI003D43E6C4